MNGQGERGFYVMNGSELNPVPDILNASRMYFVRDLVVFSLTSNNSIINASEILGTPKCNRTDTDDYPYSFSRGPWVEFNLSFYGYSYVQSPADNINLPDQDAFDWPFNLSAINYGLSQQCDIFARQLVDIQLYDPAEPARGFKLIYNDGDDFVYDRNYNKSMEISFICDDNGAAEDVNELNDIFGTQGTAYLVETTQDYEVNLLQIEIYTSGGCPARCQTYVDEDKTMLQLCNGNGICRQDDEINNVRCFCDDDEELSDEFYCKLATSSPSMEPTKEPSSSPTDLIIDASISTTDNDSNAWMIGYGINLIAIIIVAHFV